MSKIWQLNGLLLCALIAVTSCEFDKIYDDYVDLEDQVWHVTVTIPQTHVDNVCHNELFVL